VLLCGCWIVKEAIGWEEQVKRTMQESPLGRGNSFFPRLLRAFLYQKWLWVIFLFGEAERKPQSLRRYGERHKPPHTPGHLQFVREKIASFRCAKQSKAKRKEERRGGEERREEKRRGEKRGEKKLTTVFIGNDRIISGHFSVVSFSFNDVAVDPAAIIRINHLGFCT